MGDPKDLLGMQFGDPTNDDWKETLLVSERVNNEEWHEKLVAFDHSK